LARDCLFRSDHLNDLTNDDWVALKSFGLRTICDLRSPRERQRHPSMVPLAGVLDIHLPIMADVRADPRYTIDFQGRFGAQEAEAMMVAIYRQFPGALAPHLRQLFKLLECNEAPVLLHCTAGKDRTGFVTAVLLHALGIDKEAILADYLRTADSHLMTDAQSRMRLAENIVMSLGMNCSDAAMDTILDVRESFFAAAFEELELRYGSLDGYLEAEAAMDAKRISQLRNRYLSV